MPTRNFFTMRLAKELGKMVADVYLGGAQPMSAMEHYLWQRFDLANARLEQQSKRR